MGDLLLKIFVAEYVVIMAAYIWDGNWPKAVYFLGAGILTGALLWMK